MNTRGFFQLVRVFLTPSAPADSLVGWALASTLASSGTTGDSFADSRLGAALLASVFLYWYGMASNDLFDAPRDRTRAPSRPIPAGRVSLKEAARASAVLALLSLAAAAWARALVPAAGVVVLATLYNAGGKRIPVAGNLLMGGCRAGNLLLGAVAAGSFRFALEHPSLLTAAGILGLFVAALTAVSVLEDRPAVAWRIHVMATPLLAAPVALVALHPTSAGNWLNAAGLALLLAGAQKRAASASSAPSAPHPAAIYVRRALSGIYLVDAGLLWSLGREGRIVGGALLIVYSLAALGWLWKRRWLRSGGQDT